MLSQTHENFCKAIVRGLKPEQAAVVAGYTPATAKSKSHLIAKRPEVIRRIEQLRAESALRLHYTVAKIIEEIEAVQERARAAGDNSNELKAIMHKAEMLGLKPKDRSEIDVNLVYKPLAEPSKVIELTPEEWAEKWSPKLISSGNGHA